MSISRVQVIFCYLLFVGTVSTSVESTDTESTATAVESTVVVVVVSTFLY